MSDAEPRWWCPRCDAECNRHRPAPVPAAPNEHSPEAIAAYPANEWTQAATVAAFREAFDRGMKAGRDAALTEAASAVEEFGHMKGTELLERVEARRGKKYARYCEACGCQRGHFSHCAATRSLQEGDK